LRITDPGRSRDWNSGAVSPPEPDGPKSRKRQVGQYPDRDQGPGRCGDSGGIRRTYTGARRARIGIHPSQAATFCQTGGSQVSGSVIRRRSAASPASAPPVRMLSSRAVKAISRANGCILQSPVGKSSSVAGMSKADTIQAISQSRQAITPQVAVVMEVVYVGNPPAARCRIAGRCIVP
jgi:hypothetical protein